ncbi:paired amphipathic helix protein SIN3 2-like [Trifolium pratense]|uniref:Paired amphipathic helix protein SIN3 2-like n=2 Tax=Trifolium pratense TaxID=57577 RepID=A0A2K3LAR1_TRIPR|nr:paired amphipathic helix protein SIN3 2-like [Trifolium pratense]
MMIRSMMRLLSRSRVRMLAGGGGGGGHGSTVNFNYRRWSSASSSSFPPISAESIKEAYKEAFNGIDSLRIDEAKLDKLADFMMELTHVFQDEPEKLFEFVRILLDFRIGSIDLSVFKERLTELLKGHNNLIWKFNNLEIPGVTSLPLDDDGLPFKYDLAAVKDDQE